MILPNNIIAIFFDVADNGVKGCGGFIDPGGTAGDAPCITAVPFVDVGGIVGDITGDTVPFTTMGDVAGGDTVPFTLGYTYIVVGNAADTVPFTPLGYTTLGDVGGDSVPFGVIFAVSFFVTIFSP